MSWIEDTVQQYRRGEIDFPTLRDTLANRVYPPPERDPELEGDYFSQDFSPGIEPGSWLELRHLAWSRNLLSDPEYFAISRAHDEYLRGLRRLNEHATASE